MTKPAADGSPNVLRARLRLVPPDTWRRVGMRDARGVLLHSRIDHYERVDQDGEQIAEVLLGGVGPGRPPRWYFGARSGQVDPEGEDWSIGWTHGDASTLVAACAAADAILVAWRAKGGR